ncbi:MAG: sialidase family protein [Terriglobales bacterium]
MKTQPHSVGRGMLFVALAAGLAFTASAPAQVALTQLSQDTFTDSPSQHDTEVEPGTFSWGSTIVTAFQVARIFGGGGADIGFATSTNGGETWTKGYLPGITIYEGNGLSDGASDAAVAYDALHNVWLISSLPIGSDDNTSVAVSRSTDGLTWSGPVSVTTLGSPDKNWIVCDNTATSKYYGHCYSEWDDTLQNDLIEMSTSTDGGMTWSKESPTAGADLGVGGVPMVLRNGTVVVPINAFNGDVIAFTSTNGGDSWNKAVNVASNVSHAENGGLRSIGLVSSAQDASGKVYVAWSDCRYRASCAENDIVYSTSTNGTKWTAVKRIPIDAVLSTVDHFITGLGIAPGTKGATAHLALAYYYYPVSNCTNATCELYAGFIQSSTAGNTWSAPETLAGPMYMTWLPNTFSGRMVADYVSVGFGGGKAFPVFAAAENKYGAMFREAIYTTASGQDASVPEREYLSSEGDIPIPNAHSDHGPREFLDQEDRIPVPGKRPPERD